MLSSAPTSNSSIRQRNRLADIVVRAYEDHIRDGRLAARLAASSVLRDRGSSLHTGEHDVLERVRRGELSRDSVELDFRPACFVTVQGVRHLRGGPRNARPLANSFGVQFRSAMASLEQRLREQRLKRYARLGGSLDGPLMDKPLWDYVREFVATRLDVEEAGLRLRTFARLAAEGRSPLHDPVANDLDRLDREGCTDELLEGVRRLYPVQTVVLNLCQPAEELADTAAPRVLDEVPPLDRESGEWITAVAAGYQCGVKTSALKAARARARENNTGTQSEGIDPAGRIYRVDPDISQVFRYLKSSLNKKTIAANP